MRIRVFHETNYTYEQPARGLIQLLRLRPRDHDGQYVRRWRIEPSVDGRVSEREDGFGNVTHWFTADEPADALTIRVTGEVDTNEMHGIVRGTVERLPDVFYLRDSDLAVANSELQAFAKSVVDEGDSSVLPCLHRLLAAVFDTIAFEPGPASASTTAAQSFAAERASARISPIFSSRPRDISRFPPATSRAISSTPKAGRTRERGMLGRKPWCPALDG